mgnify:CR=1 FL=1
MSASLVCQTFLQKSLAGLHAYRRQALIDAVCALMTGGKLTLISIGRHLPRHTSMKHNIKRIDRLLGNPRLHNELFSVYCAAVHHLLRGMTRCVIAVDWSGCCSRDFHTLRAALLYDGRAIPLFNYLVPEHRLGHPEEQTRFLAQPAQILGARQQVIIVTDAGFALPWITAVRAQGWDVISRIRGHRRFCLDAQPERWDTPADIADRADSAPRHLGAGWLGRDLRKRGNAPFYGQFYLYRQPAGRPRNPRPNFGAETRRHRALHQEPWLLVSSLTDKKAAQIIRLYRQRMQIEQNFRDDKSPRYGAAWRESLSHGLQRISVLCLLSTLAAQCLWLVGFYAEHRQWHRGMQSNSTRHRRVLSFITPAKYVLADNRLKIKRTDIEKARRMRVAEYQRRFLSGTEFCGEP